MEAFPFESESPMPRIVTATGKKKARPKPGAVWFLCLAPIAVAVAVAVSLTGKGPTTPIPSPPTIHTASASAEALALRPDATPAPAPHKVELPKKAKTTVFGPEPEPTNKVTGLPQSQHEAWQKREDERHAREKEAMDRQSPQYFDNPAENMIARVSRPNAKFLIPPTLTIPEDELMEILARPVEIYDDDTEEAIAVKERTAAMKEEIKKYIAEGGTINQYFRDVLAMNTERDGIRSDVHNEKRRLLLEKGEAAAQAYLDSVNPQLKEMGLEEQRISPVDLRWMRKELADKAANEGKGK